MEGVTQLLERQQNQIELLTNMLAAMAGQQSNRSSLSDESIMEKLSNAMELFLFEPDESKTFDNWYRRYTDLFMEDGKNLSDAAKVRLLLRKLGQLEHNQYLDHILPKVSSDLTFDETVKMLSKKFSRPESLFSLRWKCLQAVKQDGVSLTTHAANINRLCEDFQLKKMTDDQFKCIIFIGSLQSDDVKEIRTRLLSKVNSFSTSQQTEGNNPNMTLDFLVQEAERIINLEKDTNLIAHSSLNVNSVEQRSRSTHNKASNNKPSSACWNCGEMHFARFCEFKNHKCTKCHKIGHKDGYCSFKNEAQKSMQSQNPKSKGNINVIQEVNAVEECHNTNRRYVTGILNNIPIRFQLDSASDVTIISKENWSRIGNPKTGASCSEKRLKCASNQEIKTIATFEGRLQVKNSVQHGNILVTEVDNNLLGIDFITKFGFWDVPFNSICNKLEIEKENFDTFIEGMKTNFPDLFQNSLGLCKDIKAFITLKENAKPVFRPKRPVAYAVLHDVETELDRLQELGIISPVEYSSWATPIVVVRKSNGKLRICADFSTGLNSSVESNHYPLPLLDDIFAKLAGNSIFSKIDLADAFLQFEVDSECKKYLTINTHKGLYQYNRLPFGVKTAPAIFQSSIEQILSGLEGVIPYIDDLLIYAPDTETMKQRVEKILQRLNSFNLRVRLEKCEFFTEQVKYLGFIVDKNGIHSDPDKVNTILEMPQPSNIQELRSFLGAINYYGKFLPRMHDLRAPLNKLLNKDIQFIWDESCQQSFNKFKELLSSDLLLTHFDPSLPLKVSADASNKGVGACISHIYPDGSEKPIAHASRTLTHAEKNYSQIEKEGLAIMFATTKFHRFLYGRKFQLHTDHKPLLTIFGNKNGIPVYTANRLQRWALTLLAYDFDIHYTSTEKFGNADILSRLISQQAVENEDFVIAQITSETDLNDEIDELFEKMPITRSTLERYTSKDRILKKVIYFLQNGWPPKESLETEILQYFYRRDSLSLVKGCLMFSERIVVPYKLRKAIIKLLHKNHFGVEAMKMIARSYVFWPNIDKDIATKSQQCSICAENAKIPIKTLLRSWPKTSRPLERIHADIAGPVDNKYYLIIVDSFSMVPAVFSCTNITSTTMLGFLSEYFAWFGNAETLVTDNGPQFTSAVFEEFCASRGCQHIKTPPYHPMSNGRVERFVDTLKRGLKKIKAEGGGVVALNDFLQRYRSTPNRNIDSKSPMELFINKKIRTNFDLLVEEHVKPEIVRNEKMESQFNKHHGARQKEFQVDDEVLAKVFRNNKWIWSPGRIVEKVGSVIYVVWLHTKRMIRSHANQLKHRFYNHSPSNSCIPFDILTENSFVPNQLQNDVQIEEFFTPPTHAPVVEITTPAPVTNEDNAVAQAPITRRNRRNFGAPGVTTRSQKRLQFQA